MMKKFVVSILSLALALVCVFGQCNHVHDENCGFDPETGEGCTHVCDLGIDTRGKTEPDE